jgi:hypothetical protein
MLDKANQVSKLDPLIIAFIPFLPAAFFLALLIVLPTLGSGTTRTRYTAITLLAWLVSCYLVFFIFSLNLTADLEPIKTTRYEHIFSSLMLALPFLVVFVFGLEGVNQQTSTRHNRLPLALVVAASSLACMPFLFAIGHVIGCFMTPYRICFRM